MIRSIAIGTVVLSGFAGIANAQISLGQVDTFDSSTQDWGSSFSFQTATWSPGSGPGGAGDNAMQIQSSGAANGPGSRLGAWNDDQWSGDYIAAGVSTIEIDIAGVSGSGAELRLFFLSNTGANFTSNDSVFVPTDGVWRTYTFDISEYGLTQVGGVLGYDASFADMGRMHLRHQPGAPAGLGGVPAYDGAILVDNIRAVPGVPTSALIVFAAGCFTRRRQSGDASKR